MKIRVAITSMNGTFVDQHFGKATAVFIVDLSEDKTTFIEKRNVKPHCGSETDIDADIAGLSVENSEESGIETGSFSDTREAAIFGALSDCNIVVTSQIGLSMRANLTDRSIDVFEMPGLITDAITALREDWSRLSAQYNL